MQLAQLAPASASGAPGLSGANSSAVDDGDTITVIERPVNIETSDASKSPLSASTTATSVRLSLLPWNSHNRSAILSGAGSAGGMATTIDMMAASDGTLRPGEIVMRTLFTDFTVQAEKKIESVLLDGSDKNLPKLLQRGEDYQFDQLLQALGSVAEHCLPSLLKALLAWHKHQICDKNIKRDLQTGASSTTHHPANKSGLDLDYQLLRREAAVEFIFCLALIEILRQFPFHPGHDDITKQIENLAFRQFKYKEGAQTAPNANDCYRIADLYAEVVGVLAQSRFSSVRKRFMTELKELRSKEPSPFTTHSIISLLMGMKFFRVKMAPIEEFEASFQFMHECAQYFLEVKDKDIKHAMAGLFVEILVPVAATVKNEVNVPCVKNFIDLLYSQTLDACTKSKHKLALFPLVTCLLCVSQKSFFLSNWHCFLAMCLSNLKNKDPKMSRVALESLYRLLWVYIIRIKCESNSATHSRLQSIVNSLFPRGSKAVVPRDTPLNIFVKIIQFIAQERLDFAMREIVFELLCVGRPIKIIMTPERMSIGLRAFMVVADSLQQKDGEPPMPRTVGVLPSGNTLRVKKTYLNKMLTEDTARSIGMSNYFPHVRRVFVDILRALDIHCGRPLMMTVIQNQNKEFDEMLTGERKPRIDLFRTCIAAVPRLTPDNMTGHELVDMLSRLTIHMDEELRGLAHQSLQTLVCDFPEWRQDVIQGFSQFLARDVVDTFPQLLDNGLRMLYAFLTVWRNLLGPGSNSNSNNNTLNTKGTGGAAVAASGQPVGGLAGVGRATNQQDLGLLKPNLPQTGVNASLNAATINSNSSGSSGISSITQTTTITAGAIGGVGTSSSSGMGGTAGTGGTSESATASSSHVPGGKKGHELPLATTMHMVEGLALVMLCNCRSQPRKFAVSILKEVKVLKKLLGIPETEPALIDVIDKCCPQVLEKCLHMLPQTDRTAMLNANVIDLQWIVDRNSGVWTTGHVEESTKASTLTLCLSQSALGQAYDPWSVCLFGFMERTRVLQHCPSVVAQAWPICYQRVTSLFNVIDPTPVSDNRASLLRSSAPTKKPPSEAQRDSLAHLWKNQVALAMRLIPQMPSVAVRCASPDLSLSSSPDSLSADRSDKSSGTTASPVALYKLVIPLLRCEVVDIRDAAVNALGMINHDALKDLMEELVVYIREAIDRKQENMRRRRRRDALRLQLVRVLEKIAENGTFGISQFVLERETMSLHPTFVEYIDGARLYLETETDGKDSSSMREVKTHFCDFIRKMIKNFSLESCGTLLSRELKRNLVNLFVGWSGTAYALPFAHGHHGSSHHHGSHHGVGGGGSGGGSIGGIGSGVSGIGSGTIGASVWGSSSTTSGIGSAGNTSAGTIAAEEEKLQFSALQYYPDSGTRGRREGSGSTEATEMILNNLFYITAKVILRYLLIISGMAPNELLANAKRVALYLARSCTNRLLDELMSELQTVETLNCLIERTETPPFYRLTSMRKASSHSDGPASGNNDPKVQDVDVEKGTIHTKRHSGEDPIKSGTCKSDSALRTFANAYRPPRGSDKIRTASGPCVLPRHEDVMMMMNEPEMNQEDNFVQIRTEQPTAPHPLPMPEYGGYFAPLTEFLPDTNIPISGFHRCNVAVMLLTDIVVDGIPGLDWTLHVPLMLHILFLGLDHTRRIVRDHCKKLLLNLLIVLAEHNDHLTVAKILLNSDTSKLRLGIVVPSLPVIDHNFTEPDQEFDSYLFGLNGGTGQQSILSPASNQPNEETPAVPMIVTEENAPPQPGPTMPTAHVIKSLIKFLSNESSQQQPLWNYEDITAKVWSIKSADQLQCFLRHIVKAFTDSYPHARIPERWAQTALQLGLSCSSRHYAGRSLQVFRSLNVPINSRMLSDILSRLIETVAEQGEDMQGYVTELLLTLEAAVDSLDSDFRPLDVMKDIFKSTPNLNNKEGVISGMYSGSKRSGDGGIAGGSPGQSLHNATSGGHTRSTSYSISYCSRKAANSPIDKQIELRNRNAALEIERNAAKFGAGQASLSRSRSAQSLKLLGDTATQDDKMTILAQLFWLAVSLLESDYEHEFLLALRLLTRVLHRLPLDRPDARDKVEKLQQQLKWSTYPGVHALLLKGCTHSGTYEASIALLSQLTPLLNLPVCDPTQSCAFPMNVIALLPYMLLHYEDANEICIRSAENIAQVASEMGLKLENLGTVMTLYSRKTFSKESFQWTKCVVKYLYDTYAHMGLHMLAFLTEVLEKGWVQVQLQVLSVIHCMLHYVDLSAVTVQPIAGDMLRIISKYLDSPNWKEALKILKFVVTRSSSLQVVPQSSEGGGGGGGGGSSFANLHGSFSDSEVFCKKELAGRTMEFSFDVSQTPLIGRKLLLKSDNETGAAIGGGAQMGGKAFNGSSNVTGSGAHYGHAGTPNSPRRSASLSPADTAPLSGWKRPWMSQGRVREGLVNLLTTCGQRVGLPKSPSVSEFDDIISSLYSKVIFSQSSDLLERQSSAASSTDETSGAQQDLSGGSKRDDGAPDFGVFKDFDFLEYESESIEGESTDNFNWGVRRRPLSEGENEPHSLSAGGARTSHSSNIDESLSEKTPIFNRRKRPNADDSSDEEVESESPLDEEPRPIFSKAAYLSGPPTSLSLRERRHRRDSVSRSDTSGSSAGDLGDITPCNASPHLPGMHPFRTGPIRDESVDVWRRNLVALLVNQPSSHAPDLLNQMFRLMKELTVRSIAISKECMRYFTGCGVQLGHRISVLSDLLVTRGDPPKIWYHQSLATTPRLFENLRYGVLEVQEHLETFFDRKETVLDSLDEVKASCKLALFTSDIDSANEGTGGSSAVVSLSTSTDPATAELLLDLGRGLYKLMFQLLLLIESDHKIAISVVQNLRQNEQMQDLSNLYMSVRGALLRCIDDAEMESLDTSTSTEGENTPTPSPGLPMNNSEFENILVELIDNQRWSAAINHVKQHKQMSNHSASNYNLPGVTTGSGGGAGGAGGSGGIVFTSGGNSNTAGVSACGGGDGLFSNLGTEFKTIDDLSLILNVYAHRLTKDRNDVFIVSRSEFELSEIYQILMENLLHVSSALSNMEISMKANTSSSSSTVTTMTTIPAVIGTGGGSGGSGSSIQPGLPGVPGNGHPTSQGNSGTGSLISSTQGASLPPPPPVLAPTNPFKDTVDIITTL
uniref:Protein furry n=1 Tax=Anopheles stephensi TaxID=30069 RepID=A0A182YPI0_ANOST